MQKHELTSAELNARTRLANGRGNLITPLSVPTPTYYYPLSSLGVCPVIVYRCDYVSY